MAFNNWGSGSICVDIYAFAHKRERVGAWNKERGEIEAVARKGLSYVGG